MRYELFSKKSLSSEKLPPTSDALCMRIRRVNYKAYIRKSSTVPILDLPPPLDVGWTSDEEGHLVPVKMTRACAQYALLDFTKCSCKQNVKPNDTVVRTKTLSVQIFVSVAMKSVTTELSIV